VVNVVGRDRHVATWPDTESPGGLVAIGMGLDEPAVRARLETVLAPCAGRPALDGVRRIARLRRLSA
ncbi:MAG: cobalamin biosynthesis protein CobW, partial [Frankia sp.]|nr:cobalamin biosynthesis protein CobW [Frankia sp.]